MARRLRPATSWETARDQLVSRQAIGSISPKTANQKTYWAALERCPVTLCLGPAGSGKTLLACAVAARMLQAGAVSRIVLSRPLVDCGERLGTLPGGVNDKTSPYIAPLHDALEEFFSKPELSKLEKDQKVLVCPLAVMRGRTLKESFVILDEAQDATYGQLRMFLTRIGNGSKVVVCGDDTQSDLHGKGKTPLTDVAKKLQGHDDVAIVRLSHDDVLRHPLVKWIDQKLA